MAMAAPYPRPVHDGGDTHLWLAGAGLLVVLASLLLLGASIMIRQSQPFHGRRLPIPQAPAPRPDDAAVLLNNTSLAIAPTDAVAINAARPLDRVAVSPARPFMLTAALFAKEPSAEAALTCLTQAIYYEAASESDAGQRAVAQIVLNRVRNPLFPHSVCGAVFQGSTLRTGCQFSFTCDGSLARLPAPAGWARARRIALGALGGWVERSVGLSTHYHANYVVPYWANSLDKVATIGAHIFYTMRGSRGRPASFTEIYDAAAEGLAGVLPDEAALDAVVDPAEGVVATPRDRTVVQEDALGAPAAAVQAPTAASGTLRADEAAGQLVIDRKPEATGAPR